MDNNKQINKGNNGNNKIRKVFLDNLPRKNGFGTNIGNLVIDWIKSIGYKVKFTYDDTEGWIEIVKYKGNNQNLTIKYNNEYFNIKAPSLLNANLGNIINNVVIKAPWMVKYFQGGYDEAKLYTIGSHKEIYPICPECGRVKDKPIEVKTIYYNTSIFCSCSDGISYPNKFMFNILAQLRINFVT